MAQINLSQFFAAGRGVERDVAQSYFWLLLATGQRNSWAKARIAAAAGGVPDPVAVTMRARAANWSPEGGDLTGQTSQSLRILHSGRVLKVGQASLALFLEIIQHHEPVVAPVQMHYGLVEIHGIGAAVAGTFPGGAPRAPVKALRCCCCWNSNCWA